MKLREHLLSEQWGYWVATVIGAVALLIGLIVSRTDVGKVLELRLLDARFLWRGRAEPESSIVVLGIDEESIDFFRDKGKPWPWPNRIYAEAVQSLTDMGASVIVFDKIFKDPTSGSSDEDEQLLAQSAKRHGKTIYAVDMDKREVGGIIRESVNEPLAVIAESGILGFIDLPMDEDGAVRRVTFLASCQGKQYLNLDLQAYLLIKGKTQDNVHLTPKKNLQVGSLAIPLDFRNSAYINYPGKSVFEEYAFFQLFDPEQKALLQELEIFRGKTVFIGVTSELFHDDYVIPFSRVSKARSTSETEREFAGTTREYGVHIHAAVLHTLLKGPRIQPVPLKMVGPISTALGLLVVLLLSRAGFKLSLLLSVGLAFCCMVAGFWLFLHHAVYMNLVSPLSAIAFPSVAMLYYKFLYEQSQKSQIRSYWSRYVSDDIVDLMVKGKISVELGGQRRRVTVLMSDIRDFTPLCERLSPSDLIAQLNEYFSEMARAIFAHGGTIDKFIGDAIMAYWGFPHEQDDHPQRACLAAVEMLRHAELLCKKWEDEGKPTFRMGVGINTGDVVIGNVGAEVDNETIQNFTLLGDAVNLAARLESENKNHGTTLIVSEYTWEQVRDLKGFRARSLGELKVKGKSQAIQCYSIELDETVQTG